MGRTLRAAHAISVAFDDRRRGTYNGRARDSAPSRCKSTRRDAPLNTLPGEVYVLNDGGEVDLDLGNYERYLDVTLSRDNNITTGKIYSQVIEREVRLRTQRTHAVTKS